MNISAKTRKMTRMAILAACIVVLQLLTAVIKFGAVNPSLVLVPVILAGILFGPREGAMMGGVFGLVVFLMCVFALDPGGYLLFAAQPALTFFLCLLKGILAGWLGGLVYRFFPVSKTTPALNAILPAVTAPVVNTGIFSLFMLLFYRDILLEWAGGTDTLTYLFTAMIGVNFVVELFLNVILCPVLARALSNKRGSSPAAL